MQIYNSYTAGKLKEAQKAQLELAKMEWGFGKGGINGTKWVVAKLRGYPEESCHCRRPYPMFDDAAKRADIMSIVAPFVEIEKSLC